MPSKQQKSKSRVRIHIEKGALPGYTLSLKRADRREILDKLVKKLGWSNIVKKLNVLYIYNMNRYPVNAAKFRRDMYYIQKKHSPKHKTSAKSYSQKRKSKKSKKSKKSVKKSKPSRKTRKSKKSKKSKSSKKTRKSKKSKKSKPSRKTRKSKKSKRSGKTRKSKKSKKSKK